MITNPKINTIILVLVVFGWQLVNASEEIKERAWDNLNNNGTGFLFLTNRSQEEHRCSTQRLRWFRQEQKDQPECSSYFMHVSQSQPPTIKSYRFGQPTTMETSITTIQHNRDNGTVTLMKGKLYASADAIPTERRNKDKSLYQKIAVDFVNHYRSLFKLKQPDKELIVSSIEIDNLDYKHVRLQQVYQDIPVWGSELIVHINADEVVYLAGGHYIPSPDNISLKPAFNEEKAIEYATELSTDLKHHCPQCKAQLVIYFDNMIKPQLAYLVEAGSRFSRSSQLMLNAHTGDLLSRIPSIQTSNPSSGWKIPKIKSPIH
jgi:Zn-dependent metalloprotease